MVGGGWVGMEERRGGGGRTEFMHGCSRMTSGPRVHANPGRSKAGFHRPDAHFLRQEQRAVRCSTWRGVMVEKG